MTKSYIALIRKEDATDFWVDIPDIPGCVSSGESPDEAIANFEDALAFHLEGMREAGLFLPDPRALADVVGDEPDPFVESYCVEIDDQSPVLKFSFSRLAST